ncbi:MAG: nucleotidyltransferase [Chitinivibrionales bacterium]|nr:nucleotidyltransferase [Chitinivibrionales bacterium]
MTENQSSIINHQSSIKTPQLVIMAAGIGSRYGGLKQIDPIGPHGEIIIDYSLYDALRAGFERVVFIIRKHFERDFREKIGRTIEQRADVAYVFQEIDALPSGCTPPPDRSKPWGTGHAALCARPHIDAPSALINADDFYGAKSFETLYSYLKSARDTSTADYCMVGYVLANTLTDYGHVARGVCSVTPDGFLSSVVERTKVQMFDGQPRYTDDGVTWVDVPAESTVSMNMWGFTPSFYEELEARFGSWLDSHLNEPKSEYYVPTVVNELLEEQRATVRVLHSDERWYGVTYQQDKPLVKNAVQQLLQQGAYPQKLWT